MNHQRLCKGVNKKKIEWGSEVEKPENHPDEIVKWEDLTKTPRNMTVVEFEAIAIPNPVEFPIAPFKPQKSDYFRQLIRNILISRRIDPETHFDKAVFTAKKRRDLAKGATRKTKHRLPQSPPRQTSTPQHQEPRRSLSAGTSRLTRRSLSVSTTRPSFIPPETPIDPPDLPSFDGSETEPLCEYENIRASNIAERQEMFRTLNIAGSLEAVKETTRRQAGSQATKQRGNEATFHS